MSLYLLVIQSHCFCLLNTFVTCLCLLCFWYWLVPSIYFAISVIWMVIHTFWFWPPVSLPAWLVLYLLDFQNNMWTDPFAYEQTSVISHVLELSFFWPSWASSDWLCRFRAPCHLLCKVWSSFSVLFSVAVKVPPDPHLSVHCCYSFWIVHIQMSVTLNLICFYSNEMTSSLLGGCQHLGWANRPAHCLFSWLAVSGFLLLPFFTLIIDKYSFQIKNNEWIFNVYSFT